MNLPLLYNRDVGLGNGGWIHIVPKGEIPNSEQGIIQVLDDQALDSIMASWRADAQRLGDDWPGVYMGIEHHIYDPKQSSAALAWAKRFEKREDGIWAAPEFTDTGAEAIKNRRFKFTSFVTDPESLEPLGNNRFRVLRVDTVGFTNLPNAKELLTPVANRASDAQAAKVSGRQQADAARRIGELAAQAQKALGGSLASAYIEVLNRENHLCNIAKGRTPASVTEPLGDAAEFASTELLRLAHERKGAGFAANLVWVQNRFPRLAKLANRGAGWDSLRDLEAVAHSYYMDAVARPRMDLYPLERWHDFLNSMDDLAVEFPDLGYEGRWLKFQELYPKKFWSWVLTFDDRPAAAIAESGLKTPILCSKADYAHYTDALEHALAKQMPR